MGVGEQAGQGSKGSFQSQDHQAEDQTFICNALERPSLGLVVLSAPPLSPSTASAPIGHGVGREVVS